MNVLSWVFYRVWANIWKYDERKKENAIHTYALLNLSSLSSLFVDLACSSTSASINGRVIYSKFLVESSSRASFGLKRLSDCTRAESKLRSFSAEFTTAWGGNIMQEGHESMKIEIMGVLTGRHQRQSEPTCVSSSIVGRDDAFEAALSARE